MEATALSLARSVLDGVLSRTGAAIADEIARLIGVRKEVDFIRNELEMMRAFLKVSSTHPGAVAGRSDTVRTWVKQVRDLAYDVEDCLLDFALYADRTTSSRPGSSWLPSAVAQRRRIAARIRYLKARFEELNQRNLRYNIAVKPAGAEGAAAQQAPVLPDNGVHSHELPFKPIGRQDDKDELTKLIITRLEPDIIHEEDQVAAVTRGNGAVNVVSVWGMGGMGKSSLVRMVHNDPVVLDEFDCSAWITVPHPLDSSQVFRQRLRAELGVAHGQDLEEYLRMKRYLVIVDDLLSQDEWENICQVFRFDNNMGSRIIVTTRHKDVARHCEWQGLAYELKPLGDRESKNLFFQKVYKKSDSTISPDMEERASHILKRCQGLPLAISTIGCFLANRPKTSTEWRNLHEHLGAELEFGLHHIPEVIVSSYDGLPYDLKSIFLYFSIFPENHDIRRTRLLRRWMAEGLITKNRDMPVEKVAERSYKELINRSMIQPLKAKADRCHVHSILRQIILFKSIEENQLLLVEKQSNEVPQSKTRHLVVSRWENKDEKLRNINPSYIRSLTIFGECPLSIISPKMRLLRVLDLEDTDNLKNDDLKHIGELRHLRYLSLRGTSISKLPSSLQNLRYLETFDIQDTQVMQLPSHVAKLEKLCYLLAGSNFSKDLLQKMKSGEENHKFGLMPCLGCKSCEGLFGLELTKAAWQSSQASNFGCLGLRSLPGQQAACQDSIQTDPERSKVINMCVRAPEGIEKLMNLHTLGVVNFGYGNGVAGRLKKLTNLTNLRRLGVEGLTEKEGKDLCQSIRGLRRLERLEVRSDSLTFLTQMDEDESAGPRVGPPKILRYLVSLRLCGNLSSMPKWIGSLNDLAKVKLLRTKLKQGDIEGLQNLRNLTLLGLWENSYIGDSLLFCADTFPKLKFLDIDGLDEIRTVEIRKGAMPELKKLSVMKCPSLQDSDSGLSGVPDLLNLNEVVLKQCGNKEMLTKILQRQISDHIKRPKLLVGKSIGRPTPGTVTAEQR